MRSVQRLAQSGPFRLPPSLSGRRLAVRRFSSFSPLAEEPKTRKPRAKRSASTKTASQTFNFDDLPTSLPGKDGRVQLPLQTWDARLGTWQSIGNEPSYDLSPSVASKRAARETKEVAEVKTANWYDAEVEKAIDEHRIPDTKLGREIYENMLRFSGCIVLTRVGKFYEVSILTDQVAPLTSDSPTLSRRKRYQSCLVSNAPDGNTKFASLGIRKRLSRNFSTLPVSPTTCSTNFSRS